MILPSKKVLSIFILVVALVVAIIITFGRDKASSAINYTSNLVAGEKVKIPENPNWQNELSGAIQNVEPVQITEDTSLAPGTVTDTVSTSFMANYLALEQNGSLDDTSAQKLIDQTINYIGQTTTQTSAITQSDLNVIPDNGKQSITDYGENLGMLLKTNKTDKKAGDEIIILQEAISKRDPAIIEGLQSYIDSYQKVVDEMLKMPVPKTFVKAHTDIVTGFQTVILGLKEMKAVLDDPIKGLQGLQTYQDGGTLFMQAMGATLNFIKQNNIVYKQGSGGYYLLYGI